MLTISSYLLQVHLLCIILQICVSYAAEYDINFNPDKSEFLVIPAHKRRRLYSAMCNCSFFVCNKSDKVDRFSDLGHIITSSLVDNINRIITTEYDRLHILI